MSNIFKLNKKYLTNGLVSRLFFQTLTLLVISGLLIRQEVTDTYDKFTQKQVSQEFSLLAEKIYQINEYALDEMLSNNRVISPIVLRIAQEKAKRRLSELFVEQHLLVAIVKNEEFIYRNYKPKSGPVYHNGKVIANKSAFLNRVLFVNQLEKIKFNDTEYFLYKIDFTPWQWEITFAKESSVYDYQGIVFEKSINIAVLIILLILSLGIISYYSIFLPIKKITKAIEKLHPPSYEGIVEFEFLSQHMNKTMRQLFSSIKNAKKAEQIKADFLANMSHEIRTPLNAINGLSYLALQGDLPSNTKDYLSKIDKASHSLLHIVNDILDYSKIEAHKLVIDKHAFSLSELLNDLIDLTVFDANHKNIEIIIIGQQNLPDKLIGDSLRIGQVLLNLLSNAIKFTENGQILIILEQQENQHKTRSIKVTLQDTGIGISDEQLSHLFQPFSQADSSTTRRFGGTGLGLTICQELITLMEGQLHVTSELGKGSCFNFQIPVEIEPQLNDLTNAFLVNDGSPKKRLLLIESNSIARQAIFDIAESLNLEVSTESTLQGALTKVSETSSGNEFDFLLIDNKLVGEHIFNFTQEIKELSDKQTPFIILMTTQLINNTAIQSNVDTRLQKPITPTSLLTKLQALTNKSTYSLDQTTSTSSYSLSGLHILVAEDNVINQQVITELLTNAGAQITLVDNGLKAIEIVNKENGAFNLILMDIQMPIVDGYQASAEIRKHYDRQRLPIIALSANTSQDNRDKSKQLGINGYIHKPFDPEKLFAIISDSCLDSIKSSLQSNKAPIRTPSEQLDPRTLFPASLLTNNSLLNIKMAIKNVGGNALFLKNLLIQFYQNHYGDIDRINQALANNDMQSIQHIAHTLKGVSATIGADKLFNSAQNIQKIPINNPTQYQIMVEKLKSDLTMLLEQFLPLFDDNSMVKELNIATVKYNHKKSHINKRDMETLTRTFNTLDNALKGGLYTPKSQLDELQKTLHNMQNEVNIKPLIKLVDNFEFEQAHSLLLKIMTQLGINIGQK